MILANSEQNKIAKAAKILREKSFGVNVICLNAMLKGNMIIAESVLNFLVIR